MNKQTRQCLVLYVKQQQPHRHAQHHGVAGGCRKLKTRLLLVTPPLAERVGIVAEHVVQVGGDRAVLARRRRALRGALLRFRRSRRSSWRRNFFPAWARCASDSAATALGGGARCRR